jgi:hypothetical protein
MHWHSSPLAFKRPTLSHHQQLRATSLLHRLVRVCVTVCQSQTNRVEVTGDDNRAGWEGWALDLPRTRQARRQRRCLTHEHDLTWERQFGGHGAEL